MKILLLLVSTALSGRCYDLPQVRALAMIERQQCMEELDYLHRYLRNQHFRYWQKPNVVISGVVVSFGLGLTVGFLFSAKK